MIINLAIKFCFSFVLIFSYSNSILAQSIAEMITSGSFSNQKIIDSIKGPNRAGYEYKEGLDQAILLGEADIVEALLQQNTNVETDHIKNICTTKHFHLIKIFEKHKKISIPDREALFFCAVENQMDTYLAEISNQNKISPDVVSKSLALAIEQGYPTEEIIKFKINPKWKDNYDRNLLHYAIAAKNQPLVLKLVKQGVNTKDKDQEQVSPLDLAKDNNIKLK